MPSARMRGVIRHFDITRHTITNHSVTILGDAVLHRAGLMADHVVFTDPANPLVSDRDVAGFF